MPAPPPEQAAVLAQDAYERGDLAVAAQLVGRALAADPQRKEWLALLSQLMDAVADPLELVPLRPGTISVGECAVRAYALFRRRRYHDAVDLLLQAATAAPNVPLLDWALAWLRKPETANSLNCLKLAARFQAILDGLPKLRARPDGAVPLLVRIPQLVRRLRETQVCDAAFLLTAVALLRRIPEPREAFEAAREAHELEPSYETCVALAGVYRDRGDADRAARWYQEALGHRAEDLAARLDLGDMLWDAGRLDEAEHWYRAALAVDPHDDWATPSLYGLRYERTGDARWRDQLDAYLHAHPTNARARDVRDRSGPYFGNWLPEPPEASLGAVRMMYEKWHEGKDDFVDSISLSWLEAPSVHLAYALEMERQGRAGRLTVEARAIPRPDVRQPRVPVRFQLWRYRGTEPFPALTEPPQWAA